MGDKRYKMKPKHRADVRKFHAAEQEAAKMEVDQLAGLLLKATADRIAAMFVALELGFKCAEKGMNWEATHAELCRLLQEF